MNPDRFKPKTREGRDLHATRASGNPPALLQALELAPARIVRLALHKVVIVVLAAGADEEGGREEGGRRGADLLDLGDRVGEGGGVVEHLLVEAGGNVNSSAMQLGGDPLRAPGTPIPPSGRLRGSGTYTGFRAAMVAAVADLSSLRFGGLDCVVWSFKLALP